MRIAIDFTAFLPQLTGVNTFLKQLLLHLARVDRTNQYRIYNNFEDHRLLADVLAHSPHGGFSHVSMCARPRPIRLVFQQVLFPIAAAAWKADVVHSPSFVMPYARGSARHVLTVQDMTSFSHPNCHTPLRRSLAYRRMVLSSLRRTDVVTVPSKATKQAIREFLPNLKPDRIRVVVPGIAEPFRPADSAQVQEVARRLALPPAYILYVGTIEPRKNLPILIESYRRLLEAGAVKEHLVLVGKLGWGYEPVLQQIQAPVLRERVHLKGYVPEQDLPAIYSGARLFVYPSLHEGFGFPPLEAMACGVPVVSSLSSSLAENLEGAADLVSPDDVVALGRAMERLLRDESHWGARRAQGLERARRYTWDQTAQEMLKCYEAAGSNHLRERV